MDLLCGVCLPVCICDGGLFFCAFARVLCPCPCPHPAQFDSYVTLAISVEDGTSRIRGRQMSSVGPFAYPLHIQAACSPCAGPSTEEVLATAVQHEDMLRLLRAVLARGTAFGDGQLNMLKFCVEALVGSLLKAAGAVVTACREFSGEDNSALGPRRAPHMQYTAGFKRAPPAFARAPTAGAVHGFHRPLPCEDLFDMILALRIPKPVVVATGEGGSDDCAPDAAVSQKRRRTVE